MCLLRSSPVVEQGVSHLGCVKRVLQEGESLHSEGTRCYWIRGSGQEHPKRDEREISMGGRDARSGVVMPVKRWERLVPPYRHPRREARVVPFAC